jgi:hypothetical protein
MVWYLNMSHSTAEFKVNYRLNTMHTQEYIWLSNSSTKTLSVGPFEKKHDTSVFPSYILCTEWQCTVWFSSWKNAVCHLSTAKYQNTCSLCWPVIGEDGSSEAIDWGTVDNLQHLLCLAVRVHVHRQHWTKYLLLNEWRASKAATYILHLP